uniref:Uncharacterized protein n=1 Tax=Bellilinea caldifistulae TaxID=360411 RepID=A0A7C4Q1K3_9CHLR
MSERSERGNLRLGGNDIAALGVRLLYKVKKRVLSPERKGFFFTPLRLCAFGLIFLAFNTLTGVGLTGRPDTGQKRLSHSVQKGNGRQDTRLD